MHGNERINFYFEMNNDFPSWTSRVRTPSPAPCRKACPLIQSPLLPSARLYFFFLGTGPANEWEPIRALVTPGRIVPRSGADPSVLFGGRISRGDEGWGAAETAANATAPPGF